MKLWKISQDSNDDIRTYDAAVVAAETEEEARRTHPSGVRLAWWRRRDEWCEPKDVKVELLGDAAPGLRAGVILASWNDE